LLHYGQILQSHALHFFYLASPDLLFGVDAPAEKRNVIQVAIENKDLAKKGILIRKFGQEIIKALAGKKIHGITAVPGGVHKTLYEDERQYFLQGGEVPAVATMIGWIRETIEFIKDYHLQNHKWLDTFASYPSGHLGLVSESGEMELYDGRLRAIDFEGVTTLDIEDIEYARHFSEEVKNWTFLKFPYLNHKGPKSGWNRVGPLARMNVCNRITTPLAELERLEFKAYTNGRPNNMTMHTHWARLIEMLHCAETIQALLYDDSILKDDLRVEGEKRHEGIGIIEAPRGTLIHHYLVDDKGMITRCNLIVSTTHNNEAMNKAVEWVAKEVLEDKPEITETMLNQVEIAIRAYDPCLSCATHAIGQMPLRISLLDHQGKLMDEKVKS
jgi:NAD-reducing hydrogenase large subunit